MGTNTERVLIETTPGLFGLTLTTDHVYYVANDVLRAAPFGSAPRSAGATMTSTNLANDGSFVYRTDAHAGIVWKVGVGDNQAVQVSANQNAPSYIAADTKSIVWLNEPDTSAKNAIVRLVK